MSISVIPKPQSVRIHNGMSKVREAELKEVRKSDIPHEGYELSIDNNRILIEYGDEAGRFYAHQTLNQLKSANEICENCYIKDYPRFEHRGFSVDCSRHFFNTEELKKVIDSAALVKLNKFHWHIVDDQGWRLPVEGREELTLEGGKRKNSLFGRVDEGKEYFYYFTREDIGEIVKYCADRFIEVIPEIEMPGHSSAVLHCYPELGCTGEPVDVVMKEGIFDTVLCIGNPDTMVFVKDVLDKVCDMFPGKYIHIGGDEAPRKKWQNCEKCRQKMKEYGTESYDEFQACFIKEVSDYLKTKGKTTITWNESLKGGILSRDDVIVQRWMESGNLSGQFSKKGGKIIETDFYHYYCDYPVSMTPVKKTYNYEPVRKAYAGEDSVIGIEAELWTEYIRTFDDLCKKLYPRMMAVAETAWTDRKNKDFKDFTARHEQLRALFEECGIKIPDAKDWSVPTLKRIPDILGFFKGSFDLGAIGNSVKNTFSKE